MARIAFILGVWIFILSAGCSRRDEPKPNADGDRPAVAVKDDAKPPVRNETPAVPALPGPATFAQALERLDLRELPMWEGAKSSYAEPMQIVYSASGDHAKIADFHRKQLLDRGWAEGNVVGLDLDPKTYSFAVFGKGGFQVSISASKFGEAGMCHVSVTNFGNVDARTLPRLPGGKEKMTQWHYVSYETDAKHDAVMALHRKELLAKGWTEYRMSSSKLHAKEGRHLHGFRQNGMEVFMNVKENKDGPTVVESSVKVSDRTPPTPLDELPAPATHVEGRKAIDLLRFPRPAGTEFGAGSTSEVVLDAPGDIGQAVQFYRKALGDAGWSQVQKASSENDFLALLHFKKDGYYLAAQIAKGEKPGRVNVHLENKGNFDVRNTPRTKDATEEGHEHQDEIRFETEMPLAEIADFYAVELGKHGWETFERKDYPNGQKLRVMVNHAVALTIDIGDNGVRVRSRMFGVSYPRPATEEKVKRIIDLSKVPRWKMAAAVSASPAKVVYSAQGDIAEIAKFHRQELLKRGWAEQGLGKLETPERVRLRFMKEFFVLEVSLVAKDGAVSIAIEHRGDVDTRRLPQPEDAQPEIPSFEESSRYTTALTPDAVRDFYRKDLPNIGWKENAELSKGEKLVFEQRSLRLEIDAAIMNGKTAVDLRTWGIAK